MKKSILILLLLNFVFLANAQKKEAHLYAIKSGYLKYELSGNTTGTKEMWWDDWGLKTYTYEKSTTTTTLFGMTSKDDKEGITIRNKDKVYTMDLLKELYTVVTVPYEPINADLTPAQQKKLEKDILNAFGGQQLGKEKVNGYSCDKSTLLGITTWAYKGLVLKIEGNVLGIKDNQIFTKFDKDIEIEESKFEPPKDITFVEIPAPGNMLSDDDEGDDDANDEDEDDDDDDDNDDDEGGLKYPTKYPYSLFKQKVTAFKSYKGYIKTVMETDKTMHTALFMRGIGNTMIVSVVSRKNQDAKEIKTPSFIHNGKKCYYEISKDKDGSVGSNLIIEVPKYDSYVLIMLLPKTSKSEVLQIASKFNF